MQKLELFSGTMGFSQGFEEAGYKFEKTYYSEVDKHAIANSKYNRPNAKHIGSVKHFQQWKGKLGRINILTFGSPCQNFSLAGNRKGLKGRSSSLIQYAIMAIEWFRPDVFIWENVKGAYSSNKGEDFQAIFERLAYIDGYRLEKQLLNTSWFLPQNRERIYLIGHLTGRSKPEVFPFRENDKIFIKPERARKRQSQTKNCTTLKASGTMKADDTFIQIPEKAGCLSGGGNSGGLHSDMTVIPAYIKSTHYGPHQQDRYYNSLGIMSCLPSARTEDKIKIEHNNSIRRLTEIECERLQGFPDDWTRYGNYDGIIKEISKTQRYKMLGNAVSVPVVKAIAERLKQNLKLQ